MTLFNLNKKPVPKGRWSQQQDGFALIITLTLMAFVVLLLVTLLTFSRVETTTASNSLRHNQARENARYALNMAIGELQRTAGHDNRITAQARLMDPAMRMVLPPSVQVNLRGDFAHPFWTGIWDGNGDPSLLDNWYWLVSGNENRRFPRDQDFFPDTPRDDDLIQLVGPGSILWNKTAQAEVAARLAPDPRVYAKLQPIFSEYPGLPSNPLPVVGRYAYWVGDEGVKASFRSVVHQDMSGNRQNQPLHLLTSTRGGFEYLSTDIDPTDPLWARLLVRTQASLFNGVTENGLKSLYHSLTGNSQGVLSDPVNGGLKVDLTRDPGLPDNGIGTALQNYLASATSTVFPSPGMSIRDPNPDPVVPAADAATSSEFQYPFRHVGMAGPAKPVVRDFRLRGELESDGYQAPIHLRLTPELVLWNPYTADMTFFDPEERDQQTGYRFVMRLTYRENNVQGRSSPPLPFNLRLGAGIHWKAPAPSPDEEYVSWLPATDLPLFRLQPNNRGAVDPDEEDEDYFLQFVSSEIIRLRAGEAVILSGEDLELGPENAAWDGGFGSGGWRDFDPTPPDPSMAIGPNGTRASLYVNVPTAADLEKLGPIRLRIYAVPSTVTENDVRNNRVAFHDERILVLERHVSPGDLLPDITPNVSASYAQDAIAWSDDWEKDPEVQPFPAPYPDLDHATPGRRIAPFSFQFGVGDVVYPDDLDEVVDIDPRDVDAGIIGPFYGAPSLLDGWDDGTTPSDRYAYGFGTSDDSRGMVLFDLPHDEIVTSLGQLQHLHLPGERPFLVGSTESDAHAVNFDLWDSYFFSTLENPADPGNAQFANPRMQIFAPDGLSGVSNNLRDPARAAGSLLLDGAFNLNSTSIEAWTILLHGYFRENLNYVFWYRSPGEYGDESLEWEQEEIDVPYPRFGHSSGLTYFGRQGIDGIGNVRSIWRNGFRELRPLDLSYPQRQDDGGRVDHEEYTAMNLFRDLSPPQVWDSTGIFAEEMARIIVARIIEANEPFTSVADFVNSGILQEAIDSVEWVAQDVPPNSLYSGTVREGLNWYFDGGAPKRIPASSPSYLSQSDILARIGPFLTVRSDTFVIRTYGDSRNPVTGEIEARAYCEAIVQRVPQPANGSTSDADLIAPPNNSMGRKFEIISFRWLDPSEI